MTVAQPPLSSEQLADQQLSLISPTAAEDEERFSAAVGRVCKVLLTSAIYRNSPLADLEWLVFPPVALGQCAVLHGLVDGFPVPVACALWASISGEVATRLETTSVAPLQLEPEEWKSGPILWLIEAVGDPSAVSELLSGLQAQLFKDTTVRCRVVSNGAATFTTLAELLKSGSSNAV